MSSTSVPYPGLRSHSPDSNPRIHQGGGREEGQPQQDTDTVEVSVCIANWNCRELLRACLRSLTSDRQQVRLEVIVADNGSQDGAADMVAHEFPEVKLIRNQTNLGFSRANNQAAKTALGKYLFFLNNDTEVPEGTLKHLAQFADQHPEAGMIGPLLRGAGGEIQVSYRSRPTLATLLHRTLLLRWTGLLRPAYLQYRRQEFNSNALREVEILMGAAIFAPRKSFLDAGGWDEDFAFGGEDMELSVRLGKKSKLLYWPDVEILHHGRVSTRLHVAFSSPQIAIGMVKYLRKTGSSRLGIFLYKVAMTLDAPVTMVAKGIEGLVRQARGDRVKARKSWLSARGMAHFLRRGLIGFWRA